MTPLRLDLATRSEALDAGLWQRSDGTFVALDSMNDAHLMNALLLAIEHGEPAGITHPLAAEVTRRGLTHRILRIADARELWRIA